MRPNRPRRFLDPRRRSRRLGIDLEDDPLSLLVNFFDCSIVLALAFLVVLVASPAMRSLEGRAKSRAGEQAAAEAVPDGLHVKLDRYQPTREKLRGEGERLGVAYRLKTGEVVYVEDAVK